jgi:hypothetical protein
VRGAAGRHGHHVERGEREHGHAERYSMARRRGVVILDAPRYATPVLVIALFACSLVPPPTEGAHGDGSFVPPPRPCGYDPTLVWTLDLLLERDRCGVPDDYLAPEGYDVELTCFEEGMFEVAERTRFWVELACEGAPTFACGTAEGLDMTIDGSFDAAGTTASGSWRVDFGCAVSGSFSLRGEIPRI